MEQLKRAQGVIIAGVGGQGALTVAQLLLGGLYKSGYSCLQSEVHGMSQRGGAVNAQVVFHSKPVTSPIVLDGAADLLIGIEPLETLRYVHLMGSSAKILSAMAPVKNMATYPADEWVMGELKKVPNIILMDTEAHAKTLNNRHAGNITLLGKASTYLPVKEEVWMDVFKFVFEAKGEQVVNKNIEAFKFGRGL